MYLGTEAPKYKLVIQVQATAGGVRERYSSTASSTRGPEEQTENETIKGTGTKESQKTFKISLFLFHNLPLRSCPLPLYFKPPPLITPSPQSNALKGDVDRKSGECWKAEIEDSNAQLKIRVHNYALHLIQH